MDEREFVDRLKGEIERKWMIGRCEREVARRRWPASVAEDLVQIALRNLWNRFRAGWFEQPPVQSRQAQFRGVFLLGLKEALREQQGKMRDELRSEWHQDDDDPEAVMDPLDTIKSTAAEPDEELARRQAATTHLKRVVELPNPSRRLALLVLFIPEIVTLKDFEASWAFRRGGGRFLARPPKEALRRFEDLAAKHERLAADEVDWRQGVTELCCLAGEPAEATDADRRRARDNFDQTLRRARVDLLALQAADAEDA